MATRAARVPGRTTVAAIAAVAAGDRAPRDTGAARRRSATTGCATGTGRAGRAGVTTGAAVASVGERAVSGTTVGAVATRTTVTGPASVAPVTMRTRRGATTIAAGATSAASAARTTIATIASRAQAGGRSSGDAITTGAARPALATNTTIAGRTHARGAPGATRTAVSTGRCGRPRPTGPDPGQPVRTVRTVAPRAT